MNPLALIKAIPAVLSAAASIKNLKTKEGATATTVAATGSLTAYNTVPPDTLEGAIAQIVCAVVYLYGMYKASKK